MSVAFCCRVCHSQAYVAVGRSRLGAHLYACSGCSTVFMEVAKFTKPTQERIRPTIGHLIPKPPVGST
jgi:hypothetical protein